MSSNSVAIVDREIVSGRIEGIDFGPKLWVIARSPTAVLVWVFGHSFTSGQNQQRYAEPHLTLLADRSPRFMYQPRYKNFPVPGNRLKIGAIPADALVQIGGALGIDVGEGASLIRAITEKKTLIIEGGGGALLPLNCWGHAYDAWRAVGGGFIVYPEGVTEHDATRHKLGWKPKL